MNAIEIRNLKIRYKTMNSFSVRQAFSSAPKCKIKYFEAVKGIDLAIASGDIVGLIGSNGSGKTTLLRCIAGIFSPDEGSVDLFGHTVSLLSIGVGFNPQLSGYDNIYLSGLLLGYTKQQITERIQEIIEFSELGEFIDMPVKSYSSGMYSKLAFSITAIMESDILLIDEVFSVGDAQFKKKSAAKMREIINDQTKTVVIVSHAMDTIKTFCNKVVWLDKGKVVMQGDAVEVVEAYVETSENKK